VNTTDASVQHTVCVKCCADEANAGYNRHDTGMHGATGQAMSSLGLPSQKRFLVDEEFGTSKNPHGPKRARANNHTRVQLQTSTAQKDNRDRGRELQPVMVTHLKDKQQI
jgi:hypothetical protein